MSDDSISDRIEELYDFYCANVRRPDELAGIEDELVQIYGAGHDSAGLVLYGVYIHRGLPDQALEVAGELMSRDYLPIFACHGWYSWVGRGVPINQELARQLIEYGAGRGHWVSIAHRARMRYKKQNLFYYLKYAASVIPMIYRSNTSDTLDPKYFYLNHFSYTEDGRRII